MVLAVAETTAFLEGANEIGLDPQTRLALQAEGIITVEDITEFTDSNHKTIATTICRTTVGGIDLVFGAKSQIE